LKKKKQKNFYLLRAGMRKRDTIGLAVVVAVTAAFILYRFYFIEPREWGAACVAASPPLACLPRAGLIWLQRYYLWGILSFACGLWGFAWGGAFPAQLAAILLGVGAIENYNATYGAIGLALGAWGWLRREGWHARPAS